MLTPTESRSERVDLRMTPATKSLLMKAAATVHKTLTEFLVDCGVTAAAETLADRRTFVLDDAAWHEFMLDLDRSPADNPRLRALLTRKPAWEA